MSPASKQYELERIFSYGRSKSYTVKVSVPMCELHFEAASFKGTAERLVGILGVIIGIFAGLIAVIILLTHWVSTGERNIILNLFAGGVFGLGVFIMVWAGISFWLAPLFAVPESKEARNAVKITQYWPKDQFVQLEFQNESLAEIVQKAN